MKNDWSGYVHEIIIAKASPMLKVNMTE